MSQRVIAKFLFTIKNTSFFFPSFRETTIKLLLNEINRLPLDPFSIHCHDFGGRAKRCNKTTHKINSLHKNLLSELVVYHLRPTRSMWWFTLLSLLTKSSQNELEKNIHNQPWHPSANLSSVVEKWLAPPTCVQPMANQMLLGANVKLADCAAKTTFWWHMSGCVGWLAPCLEILFCIQIWNFEVCTCLTGPTPANPCSQGYLPIECIFNVHGRPARWNLRDVMFEGIHLFGYLQQFTHLWAIWKLLMDAPPISHTRRDQQVCFRVPDIDSIVSNLQKHWIDVFFGKLAWMVRNPFIHLIFLSTIGFQNPVKNLLIPCCRTFQQIIYWY